MLESFRMRMVLPAGPHDAATCNAAVCEGLRAMGDGHSVEWTTQVLNGGSSDNGSAENCLVMIVEGDADFGTSPDSGLQAWVKAVSQRLHGAGMKARIGGGDLIELPAES